VDDTDGSTFSERNGGSRDVTLTLPNGQRTTFFYCLVPGSCDLPGTCFTAQWQASPGVNATLTPQGNAEYDDIEGIVGGAPFWDAGDPQLPVDDFDFSGWILQTEDGTQYTIGRQDLGSHDVDNEEGETYSVQAYGAPYLAKIVTKTGDTITINPNGNLCKRGLLKAALCLQIKSKGEMSGLLQNSFFKSFVLISNCVFWLPLARFLMLFPFLISSPAV
jgi:hypothetical protein